MSELSVEMRQSFETELRDLNDNLFCPDASDWKLMIAAYMKDYYSANKIPSLGDIIDDIMNINMDTVFRIAELVQSYQTGSYIMCEDNPKRCSQCDDFDECLDNIIEELTYYDYADELSPVKISWGLYEVLYKGDMCIYVTADDALYNRDLLMFYDYDNEEVLDYVFRERTGAKPQAVIINHAQLPMFDELYTEGLGNCFNYGSEFVLLHDSFNAKYSGGYYIG